MEYTYKLVKYRDGELANVIHRLPDNAGIPKDESNKDYQEFVRWCEQGNTPEPAEEV